MNPNNNPNDGISFDLSLGIGSQKNVPVEEQINFMQLLTSASDPPPNINLDLSLGIGSQERDPVEEQGNFMQLLRSASDPPPNIQHFPSPLPLPHHMIPPGFYNNVIYHRNDSGAALVPSSPLGVALPPSPSPNLTSGQLIQRPQATQGGAGALETPLLGTRLGRPPGGHNSRRNSLRADEKDIVPPYPWATTRPARIHNLGYLYSKNVNAIFGQIHCMSCENTRTLEYNLKEKFEELSRYIYENKAQLRQRAPKVWSHPKLTPCRSCEKGMKPVIGENKEKINWLFLLLGQMLGCCNLNQLRYFCDKASQHRTGAKDRVLYITYLGLCKQLHPLDLFN